MAEVAEHRRSDADDQYEEETRVAQYSYISIAALFLFVAALAYYAYSVNQTNCPRRRRDDDDCDDNGKPSICKRDGWCQPSKITGGKREEQCRLIFESIFGIKFPSVRLSVFTNPSTGRHLELDGYCRSLALAFEYDGDQHRKVGGFTKTEDDLCNLQARDALKDEIAAREGIDLIRIADTVADLDAYIRAHIPARLQYFTTI